MDLLLIGFAIAFNFAILRWKLSNKRYADTLLDLTMMAILMYFFRSSIQGQTVAMIGGALISLYLLINPFKLVLPKLLILKDKTIKRINIFVAVATIVAISIYVTLQFI